IRDIAAFAALPPDDPAYEEHQALKAGRAVLRHRAEALAQGRTIGVPDKAGTSAVLPKWADARVAFSVDYDVASGLTFAFGYKLLILSGGVAAETREAVELVGSKSLGEERQVFAALMARLQADLMDAERIILEGRERALGRAAKERAKRQPPTVQFYIWDRNSFEHLSRLMGRHLDAVRESEVEGVTASPMSWIFPAAQLLKDARNISRNSPVTIVAEAVRLLAVDIPHHYSILEVAARYQMVGIVKLAKATRRFPVSNLFKDPLSDQVPSERGLEIWSGSRLVETMGRDAHAAKLRQTVAIKLDAMLSIVRRLTDDLDETLSSQAPTIRSVMHDQARLDGVSDDGQILRHHARLMKAAEALDVDLAMAMPPQEREARYRSMRLLRRLPATEAAEFMAANGVAAGPRIHVFEFRASSLEAKIKVGDFNLSLMPEDSLRLQHATLRMLKRDHPELSKRIKDDFVRDGRRIRENCPVTVLALDRIARIVAVEDDEGLPTLFHELGIWSLDFDGSAGAGGILDPISRDFFVGPRLEPALRSYGVPPLSVSRPLFARDVSNVALRRSRRSGPSVPAERFVWDADGLAEEPSGRSGVEALAFLARIGRSLTPRQADAVSRAVGQRLSLLWGPPGTGKSRTAVSLLIALLAVSRDRKLRIAVTGPTWVAIENVAAELPEAFARAGIGPVRHVRLASSRATVASVHENLRDHILAPSGAKDDKATRDLLGVLEARTEHVVLSGTAEQIARLVKIASQDKEAPRAPIVDFMLVDEASQMDVAHAVVAFTALAEDACLTVVGDDLQMPPIHPVDPPDGGAHLVGSVYDFFRLYRTGRPDDGIAPTMLDVNYRSNAEIVDFFRDAGYGRDLRSAHPDLRIDLRRPGPGEVAPSRALEAILDPEEPLVAVVHEDVFSSQRNEAEADLVAATISALYGRLGSLERPGEILDGVSFFREGVGVVTPHRAQQAAILERLGARLPPEVDRDAMTAAVDTVERFQGQQKAVMVASFGIGDADQIAAEEEFLFGLNRFNVIASRARAKLVVVMSRSLADHLPRDLAVLRGSRLLKGFVGRHLPSVAHARIPGLGRCEIRRAGPKPHTGVLHPAPAAAAG
ncbi:DEAD/DEAH box helicase, partial [Methylobacterium hispanicum]